MDNSTVLDKWNELKALVEALEPDVAKNAKGVSAAGVRARKGLRQLQAKSKELVKLTIELDKKEWKMRRWNRAILADITEKGLDPKKRYSKVDKSGNLVDHTTKQQQVEVAKKVVTAKAPKLENIENKVEELKVEESQLEVETIVPELPVVEVKEEEPQKQLEVSTQKDSFKKKTKK